MQPIAQEDFLIQKVTLLKNDQPEGVFDLSFLKEATFVESIDLSGPRLVMTFDDQHSIIRDYFKTQERDVIEVRLSDIWLRDGFDKTIQFVIWTMPVSGNMVTLNCMQRNVDALKRPARDTIIFTRKTADIVLRRLAPGLRYDIGAYPATEDYHLLPGERPTRLLRQIAAEKGCLCFWKRGTLVFKKLTELLKNAAAHTYEHGEPNVNDQIIKFARPNARSVIADRIDRNVIGWDMVNGVVRSAKKTTKPPEWVSVFRPVTLSNLLAVPYPAIDILVKGNGALTPGEALALKWHMDKIDAPIDESLPVKVVIGTVAHYYAGQKYYCEVKGVLPA